MDRAPFLSFILLERPVGPDPQRVIAAASDLGLNLEVSSNDEHSMSFRVQGRGEMIVALMPMPHPDAPGMPQGPTSPDAETIGRSTAHSIVTAFGLPPSESLVEQDALMCRLTAAVVAGSPALGVMLGHGVLFHRADVFAQSVTAAQGHLPTAVCVDVTVAPEPNDRVSFLSHGLARYGREEFWLSASASGQGALAYLYTLVDWMISDPGKVLPTGDTIGRTAEERIVVQRVTSPVPGAADVIRLDLDDDPGPKKKKWFRR